MTIDERLESLTQSVELLAHIQQNLTAQNDGFEQFAKLVLSNHERMRRLEEQGRQN